MRKKLLNKSLMIARNELLNHPEYSVNGWLHYSFLVIDNEIVEWSTNKTGIPSPIFGYQNRGNFDNFVPKIHSEFATINKVKNKVNLNNGFEIINIRLNKMGHIKNSAACKCCFAFLRSFGCKNIHFTTEIGWAKMEVM